MRVPQPKLRRNGLKMSTVRVEYHLSRHELSHAIARMVVEKNHPFPNNKSTAYGLVKKALEYWGLPCDPRDGSWPSITASIYQTWFVAARDNTFSNLD